MHTGAAPIEATRRPKTIGTAKLLEQAAIRQPVHTHFASDSIRFPETSHSANQAIGWDRAAKPIAILLARQFRLQFVSLRVDGLAVEDLIGIHLLSIIGMIFRRIL